MMAYEQSEPWSICATARLLTLQSVQTIARQEDQDVICAQESIQRKPLYKMLGNCHAARYILGHAHIAPAYC